MNLLVAVVSDLADFAYSALFSPDKARKQISVKTGQNVVPIRLPVEDVEELEVEHAFRSLGEVLAERQESQLPLTAGVDVAMPTFSGGEVVVASPDTPLYMRPTREFDSVLAVMQPGRVLRVVGFNGRWIEVEHKGGTGWVRIDSVVEHSGSVHPYFIIKEYCGPESITTEKLRAVIGDMFEGGRAELPLRGEEYVAYKLLRQGIMLPQTDIRPRTAGDWVAIFKGLHGVHISVRPKKGSVMEYCTKASECRLAYIEAVFPDESISLSEVGEPEDGYYNERTMTKEAWQELRPAFLQFS